jgi:hypothetical protein
MFPRGVRDSYPYTNYQTLSVTIGDFDGDSLMDVAMVGYMADDAGDKTRLVCLISNRGEARSVELLSEPVLHEPPQPGAEPGTNGRHIPSFYLSLIPAGHPLSARDPGPSSGEPRSRTWMARTDAILVHHLNGVERAFYFEGGAFKEGKITYFIEDPK